MADLDVIANAVRRRRRELDSLQGEARATLLRGRELKEDVDSLTESVSDLERVNILLNAIGEERQLRAQQTIEALVTRGLQTIFDPTLSFHIVQTTKANAVTVDFMVRTTLENEVVETSVMDARGGGLATTIGFLVRLVVLLLTKGQKSQNMLVLDETFAMVSAEYLPALGEFLRDLVDKTGIQIVIVTHQHELMDYADKTYRFSAKNGETVVAEL